MSHPLLQKIAEDIYKTDVSLSEINETYKLGYTKEQLNQLKTDLLEKHNLKTCANCGFWDTPGNLVKGSSLGDLCDDCFMGGIEDEIEY